MKYLRPIWRFLFFVAFTSSIVAEIWFRNKIQGIDLKRSMRIRRRWAIVLLRGVGVRVVQTGDIPDFPCLILSNHRSYLDPILMLQHVNAFPVAKAELANWPIIGKGAKLAGILYLKRENARSRAGTLHRINETIEAGFPVIIFPEGTTSARPDTLPFKRGVFQLASKMNIPIVPVALVFQEKEDFWVGEETFMHHAGRRFREAEIHVTVHYGPVLQGTNATALLEHTQSWIETTLALEEKRNS